MSLRILYVINYYKPAYRYGGPVRSVSTLCESLSAEGARVTVLTTNANGRARLDVPLSRPVRIDGVDVTYFAARRGLADSFFYSPALARACLAAAGEHDLVIADTLWTHAMRWSVAACRAAAVPCVIPLRGALLPWALRRRPLVKRAYLAFGGRRWLDSASALQCTSHEEANAARALGLRPPTLLIPNGIEIEIWRRTGPRGRFRARLGVDDAAPLVLFVGRLVRGKRPDLIVDALGHYDLGRAHAVFAGPDEDGLAGELRKAARRNGAEGRVHFTGVLDATTVLDAYRDADVFVMPSNSESFGMAALEALAAGCPSVLSSAIPFANSAHASGAAISCAPVARSFTAALTALVRDETARRAMRSRAQAFVQEHFGSRAIARQTLREYEAIASQCQRRQLS